tara:strand:+ start:1845 stop:2483 length:639 start_codon:yes stop_codon:yes gene_type:complete
VIEQDYENKRIVIIDDCSTDGSYEKAIEIKDQYKDACSIDVLRMECNKGPSATRNKGIRYFWDDTLIFGMLDADDTYLPGKINKSVEKIAENPSVVGIVYGDVILENFKKNTKIYEPREPYNRRRLMEKCTMSSQNFITKHAFSVCGLYDEEMRTAEDWDLQLRITKSFVGIHIPEPLSTYSITGSNASDIVDMEVWGKNWDIIRERHHGKD